MLGPLVGVDHLKYLPIMRGYYKEIESQMNAFKTFLLEYVENESANASGYIQLFEEGSGKLANREKFQGKSRLKLTSRVKIRHWKL